MHRAVPDSLVHGTDRYVDFLLGLKTAPRTVVVAAIAGDVAPFKVELNTASQRAQLANSCANEIKGVPAVRLDAFTDAFGSRGRFVSVCATDLVPALSEIATTFRSAIGRSAASPRTTPSTPRRSPPATAAPPACA